MGRRTANAIEVALAIPPGKVLVPKGKIAPNCIKYGVGPRYLTKLSWF